MAQEKAHETRIFVAEEQELFRRMFEVSFGSPFVLAGSTSDVNSELLQKAVTESGSDVLLFGIKKLDANACRQLDDLRAANPKLGFIILVLSVGLDETVLLRELLQKSWAGLAVYLKQSLDNVRQISQIVEEVRRNNIIIDPTLDNQLLIERNGGLFLKNLTDREVDILSLLARGYTNYSIAQKLFIDVKTVEHHLNSIYGKLKEDGDSSRKQSRVSIARLYLEATGELLRTKLE